MQLTVRDVAKLLNISEKSVYRWVAQGTLPAYRVNEQYRFNRAELLEWATSRKINVSADIFNEPESASPIPGISDALQAGGIFYRVGGTDKPSAIRAVVETMRLPDEVDREFLFRVLLAREAMASTGIGHGIAIPHVRNPIVLHVAKPMVTLCFLEKAIDFAAIDGQPVHALFSMVSPTVRAHLHLLSRLAFALRDPAFESVVHRQGSRDEILAEARRAEATLAPANAKGD
ncbi:MAG: PTS sugar transporter subunit IIA [Planctomycetes bacterium]|nr:PTS sugar transporter subunit IIA [Planctomycetota bacterium]MBI3848365.1 PTS sugar transporter subunit IIA [Planctomycetota bacterium]